MNCADRPAPAPNAEHDSLLAELSALRAELVEAGETPRLRLEGIHPGFTASARNLLHYLALRRRDLRPLQGRLAELGLSSLGRAESHVLSAVDTVLGVLQRLAGRSSGPEPVAAIDLRGGERLLARHVHGLFGPGPDGRNVRIMVTMPREAAHDYALVHELLANGMDCVRINCAHDDPDTWSRMIVHLRRAEQALGRSCRVAMDLGGPKLRTGPVGPGPAVVRIHPARDLYGRVTRPARVWLTGEEAPQPPPAPADAVLPLPGTFLAGLAPRGRLRYTDARGARRVLRLVEPSPAGCWAESDETAYVVPGMALRLDQAKSPAHGAAAPIGALPARRQAIALDQGDTLLLTAERVAGRPAIRDSAGRVLAPATIGCTLPEVFADVRAGEPIWFDDGRIGGLVEAADPDLLRVRITHARPGGGRLRADKGINLPESELRLAALTARDIEDLAFVAGHADIVQLSFANSADDVRDLQRRVVALGGRQPAIVLKIETQRAFRNLPEMLLAAMRSPCCGVMIARGDLAVECGFERLAEVQEEILWICEAAHVPVIWATQVLESLAKEGMASRAEITDAAMGHRAECVMLNKGPFVVSAVRALDDILRRMQEHATKKRALLRELRLAHAGSSPDPPERTATPV